MAGRKLTSTVIVTDPDSGALVSLLAGEVPDDRFNGLIGDHAYAPVDDDQEGDGEKPSRGRRRSSAE